MTLATGACNPGTLPSSRPAPADTAFFPPCLHAGHYRVAGFTLLELMVVLLIIGLLAHLAAANIRQPSEYKSIQLETRRLAHLVTLASQHASLNSRLIGIKLGKQDYRFLVKTDDGWELMKDKLFKPRRLPPKLVIELSKRPKITDQAKESEEEVLQPDLVISASGEMTPFALSITGTEKISHFVLTGSFSGRIRIKTVEKKP